MSNFEDILNIKPEDVKDPVTLPAGSYNVTVSDYDTTISSLKKTPGIVMDFTVDDVDEVDENDLEEFGEVVGRSIKRTFWMSEKAQFMLKNFLKDDLGLDNPGASFAELLEEAKGRQCIAIIHHDISDDGSRVFARCDKTLPL